MERRDSPRQNNAFSGLLFIDGNLSAVECVGRDISDAGARLQFPTPPIVAEFFGSAHPNQEAECAKVRWRDGDEIGICFHAAPKKKWPILA